MILTRETFQEILDDVITADDSVIIIYSGIWTFAHRLGRPAQEVPDILMNWVDEFVGSERTIIFPTYSLSFPRTGVYDPKTAPSDIGVFSQAAVGRDGFSRTLQPMYNYALRGPKTQDILQLPCSTSWGEDGVMGWLKKSNARICSLGVPIENSCSFIHSAEEQLEVPYRFFKTFHGIRIDDTGNEIPCAETMYVSSWNVRPDLDYSPASKRIRETPSYRSSGNLFVPIESALGVDIFNESASVLKKNPYAFIKNPDDVIAWVETSKQQEIDGIEVPVRGMP